MALIVVMEDDAGTRTLIASVLRKEGHEVVSAEDVARGLALVDLTESNPTRVGLPAPDAALLAPPGAASPKRARRPSYSMLPPLRTTPTRPRAGTRPTPRVPPSTGNALPSASGTGGQGSGSG